MKKLKCFFAALLFGGALSAQGWPVFDASNWLSAIDQLYQQYDMVMNGIEQIENQYEQMQRAVEAAKGIDWNNIRFDGDFDIRNDIKDATKRANKLLTCANNAKRALTSENIKIGALKVSIADLCGAGTDGKDVLTMMKYGSDYTAANVKEAASKLVNQLTEDQKKAIWRKYGISPRNYALVATTKAQVKSACGVQLGKAEKELVEANASLRAKEVNAILEAAYAARDKQGNMPDGATKEALLQMSGLVCDNLVSLENAINEASSASSAKILADMKAAEMETAQRSENNLRKIEFDSDLPNFFYATGD